MKLLKDYWWIAMIFFSAGGWAIAQDIGQKTLEEQTSVIAAGVVQNQEIITLNAERHAAEDAKEEGKDEYRRELCADGRLTGNECDKD
jgi:hypothetical protein